MATNAFELLNPRQDALAKGNQQLDCCEREAQDSLRSITAENIWSISRPSLLSPAGTM